MASTEALVPTSFDWNDQAPAKPVPIPGVTKFS